MPSVIGGPGIKVERRAKGKRAQPLSARLELNHIPANHCDRNHDNQDQQHDAHAKTDFVDPSTHWVRLVCQR
jgi:hypothetical protein